MAFSTPRSVFFEGLVSANTTLVGKEGFAVALSSGDGILAGTANTAIGVCTDGGAKAGDAIGVAIGEVRGKCGEAVAHNDYVTNVVTTGLFVIADTAGDEPIGLFLSKTSETGQEVKMFLIGEITEVTA